MGHPESFHMEYLGIGNEEVGEDFFIRYEMIMNLSVGGNSRTEHVQIWWMNTFTSVRNGLLLILIDTNFMNLCQR